MTPSGGAIVAGTVTIETQVIDNIGYVRVEFYIDDTLLLIKEEKRL
ncbi:MAG: Ig-like domain-containing protein [Candidatus Hermodarchaeota archaeon]